MDTYMFVTEISTVGAPHMWPHLCTGDNFYPVTIFIGCAQYGKQMASLMASSRVASRVAFRPVAAIRPLRTSISTVSRPSSNSSSFLGGK